MHSGRAASAATSQAAVAPRPASDAPVGGGMAGMCPMKHGKELVPEPFDVAYGGHWPYGFVLFVSARPAAMQMQGPDHADMR